MLWTEEQEQELQMLFEEYKDSDGKLWTLSVSTKLIQLTHISQ